MAALVQDTDYFVRQISPNSGVVKIMVSTVDTVDNTNTIAVDMAKYGGNELIGVLGFTHTTADSVMITEQPTTSVTGTTLTITVGGSSSNQPRFYIIYAESNINP